MSKLLFIDFESAYSSKDGYSLSKMSYSEYLYNSRFHVYGLGYAWEDGEPHWITGDMHVLTAFFDSVDWKNTTVVAHNAKFDGSILEWYYRQKPESYVCTLGMSRAVHGTSIKGHSLDAVSNHYALPAKGIMRTDGLTDLTKEQEKELADYCKHDVWLCREIYHKMVSEFPINQFFDLDWTIKIFLRPKLVLDKAVLEKTYAEEKTRRETILRNTGIEKSVFSSNKKFPELLFSMGYEVPTKTSPSTGLAIPALALGDEGFQDLVNSGNPELEALCEARIAAKSTLLETRSQKLLTISQLGFFPFDVQFSGALQTHRYSGGNGAGGNPQNFKKGSGLRRAVSSGEGYKLLVADYSAIEARIVAFLAGEPKLIGIFNENGDVYTAFAKEIGADRKFGKECILGLGYGMGWEKFKKRVKLVLGRTLTDEEAKAVVKTYRDYYLRIPILWRRLDELIHVLACKGSAVIPGVPFLKIDDGCVILPSGLKLRYPELKKDDEGWQYKVWTKGHQEIRHLYGAKLLENISQALAGEILKCAIQRAERAGVKCYGSIHDEILAISGHEQDSNILSLVMSQAAKDFWPDIKLDVEIGTGGNWLDGKK